MLISGFCTAPTSQAIHASRIVDIKPQCPRHPPSCPVSAAFIAFIICILLPTPAALITKGAIYAQIGSRVVIIYPYATWLARTFHSRSARLRRNGCNHRRPKGQRAMSF